jgi:hypothetical protein
MRDVIFLGVVAVFFTLAAAYVRACAALIGPDAPATERVGSAEDALAESTSEQA